VAGRGFAVNDPGGKQSLKLAQDKPIKNTMRLPFLLREPGFEIRHAAGAEQAEVSRITFADPKCICTGWVGRNFA
jgi:hypothetical protein